MRKYLTAIFLALFSTLWAQNQTLNFDGEARIVENTEPYREIFDEGINGVQISYTFPGAQINSLSEGNTVFQNLYIKNFTHTQEVGLPSVPSHIDFVIIPQGATATLQLLSAPSITYNNFLLYPALEPASDEYGASDPDFIIDSAFYSTNTTYPTNPVSIREIVKYKGVSIAMIEVHPVQYNPQLRKLFVHSEIVYKVNFTHASEFIDKQQLSNTALELLPNYVLNNQSLTQEIQQYLAVNNNTNFTPNFLIITHPDYLAAADSLAAWKERMGFKTEIISSSSWTSSSIKSTLYSKYQNYTPKPDYFVLLGDNDKVPGETLGSGSSTFASDLYYACMDGASDYVPDMANGRISVSNANEAMNVVQKIINYDRYPLVDSSFYSTGVNCAYFQDAGNGYAERRFAQTSEEIRTYLVGRNYNVERVYVTGSSVNPLHWNNGSYSAGEAIPNYLRKPTFAWNGTASDINSNINSGRFYVFHRDHGMSSGWGDPYYTTTNLNSLNNGNKLPIVFSINCLTGKFMDAECFSEKLLRINNGGAVGVFGHGEVSYSGYNDGLALGLIDAIWSNPGLVPNFTGSGGVTNPTLTPHTAIFRMGDVKNQGLIRMVETWGGSLSAIKYTHELFNYFGDPSMEIKTANPTVILASGDDTINCHTDTSYVVASSANGAIATLVVDNEMISRGVITNGSATLYFGSIAGNEAYLTLTSHNRVPFTKKIVIAGGCPKARFTITSDKFCLDDSVLVIDNSTGIIAAYQWNFGMGATPSIAITSGPFYVKYATPGVKTILLTITDSNNYSVTYSRTFTIDQYCKYMIPATGSQTIDKCAGELYDDGGLGNYSDNTLGSITLSPSGASSVTLHFTSFSFENGYDFVKIYDGANTSSNLIGTYTGNSLPNGGQITSTSGSITILQQSDSYSNMSGFVANWQCNYPNSSPICDYSIEDSVSCSGIVQFNDFSSNGPNQWLWDFGDGVTSSQQHPQHIYTANGQYTVKLKVSNSFGVDSIVKTNVVTISRPNSPQLLDNERCKSGTVDLTSNYSGPGTLWWYDNQTSSNKIDTGLVFTTPILSISKTYFAEVHEDQLPQNVGKPNNAGGGAYFTSSSVHYLVFDCYKPIKLHSVKVYANTSGNRTIKLLNSGGGLIQSKTVYIASGQQKVILDMEIPVGVNLRLAGPASPHLYRNNAGVNYPYKIDNLISINHSSASSAPTSYYYYFYDWEIVEGECVSLRSSATAFVYDTLKPIPDFSFVNSDPDVSFTNTGNYGSTYYWDFGDGDFSLIENPTHVYASNGTYQVTLTSTNDCGQKFITKQVDILTANLQTNNDISSFRIFPVPARDKLNIEFSCTQNLDLDFAIVDVAGRVVKTDKMIVNQGINKYSVDVTDLAQGFYTLLLKGDNGNIIRRFLID